MSSLGRSEKCEEVSLLLFLSLLVPSLRAGDGGLLPGDLVGTLDCPLFLRKNGNQMSIGKGLLDSLQPTSPKIFSTASVR